MYQIILKTRLMESWSMSSNNLYKGPLELGNGVVLEDDGDVSHTMSTDDDEDPFE